MPSDVATRVGKSIATPRHLSQAFAAAVNDGDVRRAVACFSREGCFVTPNDTVVRGREAIGGVVEQLVSAATEIRPEHLGVLVSKEVALTYERWSLSTNGSAGRPFTSTPLATAVARWIEGSWKFEIAAPWGWPQTLPSLLGLRESTF